MRAALLLHLALALPWTSEDEVPSFAERMQPVVDAAGRGEWMEGLAGAQAILDAEESGALELAEYERAEVQFARGFLAFQGESETPTMVSALLGGVPSFETARALSGPTRLRSSATYDLGLAYLATGERWRAHLPEIAQRPDAPAQVPLPPPPAPLPNADPGETPQPPEPLDMARTLYQHAKDVLVERLRLDWRDADTRANLELCQRRLRELDEIEQQREQQEQEQQEQEQENQDQQQEGDEGEEGEEGDESQEQEEGGDQQQEPSPEDQEGNPEQPEEGEQPEPTGEERELGPEDVQPPESGGEARSAEEQTDERHLTREEVMRLLDELGDLEEQREALEAALKRARRVPVDRDW